MAFHKPLTETEKIAISETYQRHRAEYPDLSERAIWRDVAALRGCSPNTVENYRFYSKTATEGNSVPNSPIPEALPLLDLSHLTGEINGILETSAETQQNKTAAKEPEREANDSELLRILTLERDLAKLKQEGKDLRRKIELLQKENETKCAELETALSIAGNIIPHQIIETPNRTQSDEAVAVVVASDWHFGAIIRPNTVNYLNEVNPEITQTRVDKFFRNTVKLLKKEQASCFINKMQLGLIGDFIENTIHPELLEESTLSPIEQMLAAQNAIAGGLQYLLDNTDLAEISCPTASGNHGRSTEDKRASTEYKNSFEQLMFWNLAKHFAQEPRVKFQISDSYFNYTEIFDYTLRWHHGHACKFIGGVGGLLIPLKKFIYRANQQRRADTSINGHFHNQLVDYDIMVNGSLVGASAYSMRLGFPPERPQQIFRLLNAEKGWTMYAPIICAETEKKSGKIIG